MSFLKLMSLSHSVYADLAIHFNMAALRITIASTLILLYHSKLGGNTQLFCLLKSFNLLVVTVFKF